jgi:hypothetical protein
MLNRLIEYFRVNYQPGHAIGGVAFMIIFAGIAWAAGNDQPVLVGWLVANLWYYSRALAEHESQDPQQAAIARVIILNWDNWRASKFVWCFIPTTAAAACWTLM